MRLCDLGTMTTDQLRAELKRLVLSHADRTIWQPVYTELRERLDADALEHAKQRKH